MLEILNDGTIKLTRGDTARISVDIHNDASGEKYILSENDILKLTVKRNINDKIPTFQKSIRGSNVFHIEPTDTKKMSFGNYYYDVQLDTEDGDVYTVIVPTIFEVMKEVGD